MGDRPAAQKEALSPGARQRLQINQEGGSDHKGWQGESRGGWQRGGADVQGVRERRGRALDDPALGSRGKEAQAA